MTLTILLFATYRDQAGQARVTLELGAGASVRDTATALMGRYPDLELKGALAAINETYAAPDETLHDGDTLAFFPPVAGGSGASRTSSEGDHFIVTRAELELTDCVARVADAAFGAVGTFTGTVRSPNHGQAVRYIDYEGYEPMILTQMQRAAAELRGAFELGRIVFAHRLGRLNPGEASIVIAISAAHRRDALLATHAAIDRLKELLPVWKREVTENGAHWVEGSSAAAETL